jgi:hypothetical protein
MSGDWEGFVKKLILEPDREPSKFKGLDFKGVSDLHLFSDTPDNTDILTDYVEDDVKLSTAFYEATKPKHLNEDLPEEFIEKRQALAEFLLTMATGYVWDANADIKEIQNNYFLDADDIIRGNPHLLGFESRDRMGLWPESEEDVPDDVEEIRDDTVEIKPSELPTNTVIFEEGHGRWIKEESGAFAEVDGQYTSSHPDEHFQNFEILAAPIGWAPPYLEFETMEFFNHETGKIERTAINITRPERKVSDA